MTEEVRTRTRAPIEPATAPTTGRGPAPAPAAAPTDASFMYRGDAAVQAREQELERQRVRREQGFAPFRYWLPVGDRGDIIILDNDLGPCYYEHAIPGPGNNWKDVTHELCPKEFDVCPLCAASGQKESYYAMFLTIMDMRPYTNRRGVVIPHNRRLLVVKAQQQPAFVRLKERLGNLRGTQMIMSRDSQQSANIGTPEFHASHGEEQIIAAFQHEEQRAQDNRVIKAANADCYPYDYNTLFTRPSGEDLRRRYGGVVPAGSNQEVADEWGGNSPPAGAGIAPATGNGITPAVAPAAAAAPTAAPGGIVPVANGGAAAPAGIVPVVAPAAGGAPPLDDEIPFAPCM